MTEPKKLIMGVDSGPSNDLQLNERIALLRATIRKYMPDFDAVVKEAARQNNVITLHQDAFAASYHDDEYTLLGMAIKYAGLNGVIVHVVGTNQETLS